MVLLILGGILIFCAVVVSCKCEKILTQIIIPCIIGIIGFTGIVISGSVPTGKYEEWKTEFTIQLAQLNLNDEKDVKYLQKMGSAVCFRHAFESEFGSEDNLESINPYLGLFHEHSISIEIIESSDAEIIKKPYLLIQYREYKGSIWTLATKDKETRYTFYVPTGTVINENVQEFTY